MKLGERRRSAGGQPDRAAHRPVPPASCLERWPRFARCWWFACWWLIGGYYCAIAGTTGERSSNVPWQPVGNWGLAGARPAGSAGVASLTNPPAAKAPWGRLVLIGASVSAGFTEAEPFGGPKTRPFQLSRYLDVAILAPHEPVRGFAHSMLFLNPEAEARRQVALALQAKPTLVAGLDFLFWFCYGDGRNDAERLQRFEGGLKLLDSIPCALILGDIPDASGAVDTALAPEQIPSPAAIAAANSRLASWAAKRQRVAVVPLSKILRTAMANQSLSVHGHTLAAGQTRRLLQADKLHPTPRGAAFLAISMLDAFASKEATVSSKDIRWDPEETFRLVSKQLRQTNSVAAPAR